MKQQDQFSALESIDDAQLEAAVGGCKRCKHLGFSFNFYGAPAAPPPPPEPSISTSVSIAGVSYG